MSDRTVNELDNAITRRFAMIQVSEYEEDSRKKLFQSWTSEHLQLGNIDHKAIERLFNQDYLRLNNGSKQDSNGIMQFGPMHYRDVAVFLGVATSSGGVYEDSPESAVGEAYRAYILPRLLNSATYSQVDELVSHYTTLDDSFSELDLSPAIELARNEQQTQQQRMGMQR